jgi:pimeloyl-ACP methyl ester carboxylesterase
VDIVDDRPWTTAWTRNMGMPVYEQGPVTIHYDLEGDGFPVLLIALGGMRSANELWANAPWNPREALADDYRLVGMDQRNAGRSSAPVSDDDGWATYTADQLGLLDHLGIERCHVVGMCIGGPYIVGLLRADPERFASAVLLQPVGIQDNRDAFYEMFDQWADAQRNRHPEADDATWASFRSNMWDGEFVLTATPDEVAGITTPMLVAMGDDLYHPQATSREIVARASNARLVESWKEGDDLVAVDATIEEFLRRHTP